MTERIFRYLREQQPETPCLVIDLDVVENNFRRMRELLPTAHIFYAVKANPMPALVGQMARLVDGIDVASAGELQVALDAGLGPVTEVHRRLAAVEILVDLVGDDVYLRVLLQHLSNREQLLLIEH